MRALVSGLALLAACGPLAEEPDARARELAPHWRLLRPEGPGPHPAALLLSGCDGVHDNMIFWAEAFVAAGRAALIVDSHAPRGLAGDGAWPFVCAAQALRGPERAGDVAVALDALAHAEEAAGIDATDVVILGASHGGWAAMEFVARAGAGTALPGLARWPEPPEEMRDRVAALVLLYPYCGLLNGAGAEEWAGAPPTLMVLGGEDSVVSTPVCLARAAALGAAVEAVVLPGADHAFDQSQKAPFSALPFDAGLRDEARALAFGWLGEAGP